MKKNQNGFSLVELLVVLLVVGLIAGAGYYIWQSKNKHVTVSKPEATPQEIFRKYLVSTSKFTKFASKEEDSSTGTTVKAAGVFDTDAKTVKIQADLDCTAQIDSKPVNLKLTLQNENGAVYGKINDASGDVTNYQTGQVRHLTDVFSKVEGVWYKLSDDPGLKSQIDSGVYVFDTGVVASGADTNTLVDTLLNKGALKITSNSKDKENNVLKITANKAAYLETLKEVFPKLTSPDLVVDDVFGDAATKEATLILTKDGTLIEERSSQTNLCPGMVGNFIGQKFDGLSKDVSGTSRNVEYGKVSISPVSNPKSMTEFTKALVL